MDELPDLALIELFNSLPVYDQLKIRGVCKRWKVIIESNLSGRKELVIFYSTYPRPLVWFHSDCPVDLLGSIIVNEKFKKSHLFKCLFKCIKRLYLICHLRDLSKSNFINFVNRFRHLEHLQVDTLTDPVRSVFFHRLQIRLNLPNLRSFCYNTTGRTGLLQLDCPKLEQLSVPCYFRLDEKCASFKESLKFLRVASFEGEPGFELPNLEVLLCQTVHPIDISAHKNLKEIRYFYQHPYHNYYSRIYHGIPIDQRPDRRTVLNGMLEQKKRLGRNELQIYYLGIRYSLGPPEFRFKKSYPGYLVKSDLNLLLQQNGEDFKIEDQLLCLNCRSEFDEDIAAFDAEQAEKLARCLEEVYTYPSILFSYVQKLWVSEGIRTQDDLNRLPDLFPHLVVLCQERPDGIYHETRNPSPLSFRFLARFKALHKLRSDNWIIPQNELNEIMGSCRFFEEIKIHSAKLELENGNVRTTLVPISIHLFFKEIRTGAYEYIRSELAKRFESKRILLETSHSSDAAVDSLDQRGYLRKETRQP